MAPRLLPSSGRPLPLLNRPLRRALTRAVPQALTPRKDTKPVTPVDRQTLLDSLHGFMGQIITGEGTGYRYPEFRASSFPYCPLLIATATPWNSEKYRSDFFFGTGTAIHELIQKWAGRVQHNPAEVTTPSGKPLAFRPRLWGDWKCTGCLRVKSGCTKPQAACECAETSSQPHVEWVYQEVTVKWRGLSGHVDTILQVAPNAYIVVDYKTTSFRNGGSAADRKSFPYGANIVQIEVYCALLRELFGLNIVGWGLVYIHRGRPIGGARDYHLSLSPHWTQEDHDGVMKILRWANNANIVAQRILKVALAGSNPARDEMLELVRLRPCKSVERWHQWMKPRFKYEQEQFEGEGACPHLEKCTTCGDGELVNYFYEQLPAPG